MKSTRCGRYGVQGFLVSGKRILLLWWVQALIQNMLLQKSTCYFAHPDAHSTCGRQRPNMPYGPTIGHSPPETPMEGRHTNSSWGGLDQTSDNSTLLDASLMQSSPRKTTQQHLNQEQERHFPGDFTTPRHMTTS